MLLLDHICAKSGIRRTSPVMYHDEGGGTFVVAFVIPTAPLYAALVERLARQERPRGLRRFVLLLSPISCAFPVFIGLVGPFRGKPELPAGSWSACRQPIATLTREVGRAARIPEHGLELESLC